MNKKLLFIFILLLYGIIPITCFSQTKSCIYKSIKSIILLYEDGTYIEKPTSYLGVIGYPHREILSYGTYIKNKGDYYLTSSSKLNPDSIKAKIIETSIVNYDSIIIEITSPCEEFFDNEMKRSQYYSIEFIVDNDSVLKSDTSFLDKKMELLTSNKAVIYKPSWVKISEIYIQIIPWEKPFFPYDINSNNIIFKYQLKSNASNYIHIDFYDIDYYYFTYYRYYLELAKKINHNKLYFRNCTYLKSKPLIKKMNNKK
jgi:hypothetical protein